MSLRQTAIPSTVSKSGLRYGRPARSSKRGTGPLEVSSSNYPRFDRNPNTGRPPPRNRAGSSPQTVLTTPISIAADPAGDSIQ